MCLVVDQQRAWEKDQRYHREERRVLACTQSHPCPRWQSVGPHLPVRALFRAIARRMQIANPQSIGHQAFDGVYSRTPPLWRYTDFPMLAPPVPSNPIPA
ncbi:hypothetical protein GLYMA_05G091866v4 [Glycine max]|nr:hypothetical protein GLYMA_05G091866v4 [Glycine max]KAH1133558.1 hypothetical protein GYH30_012098 [Glycine max]